MDASPPLPQANRVLRPRRLLLSLLLLFPRPHQPFCPDLKKKIKIFQFYFLSFRTYTVCTYICVCIYTYNYISVYINLGTYATCALTTFIIHTYDLPVLFYFIILIVITHCNIILQCTRSAAHDIHILIRRFYFIIIIIITITVTITITITIITIINIDICLVK